MVKSVAVRFSYFGYSVAFLTSADTIAERRAEANAKIIAAYGTAPAMAYVAPELPFPGYVPQQTWDNETQDWS